MAKRKSKKQAPRPFVKVKSVKIHELIKDWDDNDPLYEVDATFTFVDGTKERFTFDWVRAGHLHSMRHPRAEEAQEDFRYLIESTGACIAED